MIIKKNVNNLNSTIQYVGCHCACSYVTCSCKSIVSKDASQNITEGQADEYLSNIPYNTTTIE